MDWIRSQPDFDGERIGMSPLTVIFALLAFGHLFGFVGVLIALPVSAVLVDMSLPFAAVANLCVGQVLPVAVARAVPLRVGGHTIAHGTVGTVDDRVAIQITNAF